MSRKSMTKAQARTWLRRWRLVARAEREELRKTPAEVKLHQLASLMASADAFGWTARRAEDEARGVRKLWRRLRRCYRE